MGRSKKKRSVKKVVETGDDVLQNYKIEMRTHERRAALTQNATRFGMIKILKQLNSVRESLQWNPRAHEIMTKDLEFLQKAYQRERA